MQPIRIDLDQPTYVRLVDSAFDEGRTIPQQAAELVKRALSHPTSTPKGLTTHRTAVGVQTP